MNAPIFRPSCGSRPASRVLAATALLLLIALSVPSRSVLAGEDDAEPRRPNIVLVMTDDQGYGDLSCTGNPILETPNIDRLAREGAALEYFYVSPVCAPTRASLMTGRYNYRTRAIDTWVGRAMMDPEEVTIAEILRDTGYRTGIFGKWHLGDCYPMRPIDQGFDEALVHRGGGLAQPSEPVENARRYTDPILFRNGRKVETHGYCTDVYFDAAIEFVRASHASRTPFFAYIPTNAPHAPFHDVPKALYEKYRHRDIAKALGARARDADNIARIFAMEENIDQNMGRLLDELEKLGIAKNTIVAYLHDNGPQLARYVGDMRGTKSQVFEGGIRTPFFVRWPARLRAGAKVPGIGAHIDVVPTLLEAANVPIPRGLRLDGRSLLPLLEGKATPPDDRRIFIQSHRGDVPVRYHNFAVRGTRWKLLRASGFGRESPPPTAPFELYDLSTDPRESHNLAAEHPEIVERMKAEYDRWFDDVSSTRPDNYAPPRIIVGNDRETRTVLTRQDWRRRGGGGWGTAGEWLLTIEGEHTYDVRVITQKDVVDGATLELRLAGETRTQTISGPGRSFVLRAVPARAGDTSLAVTISTKDGTVPPHQVIVERR